MRLTVGILAAMLCHGLLFGVAAAVLSHLPREQVAPEMVELDVVGAKPDPVADAAPPTAPTPANSAPQISSKRHMASRRREAIVTGTPAAAIARAGTDVSSMVSTPSSAANTSPAVRPSVRPIDSAGAVAIAKPRYRSNPIPDYPLPCRRRREEGVVLLNVAVQSDGTPSAISLNKSSGYALLDRAALEAVHRWTFEPARAAGAPVVSVVVVPVRFSLAERP